MIIKSITIEGMHKVASQTLQLDKLNYIYGPNGIGKSTILQAIQLALLGYIPGQSKASKEAIFRHCNGRSLTVTLTIEDEGNIITLSRIWTRVGSTINTALEVDPKTFNVDSLVSELELPIFNFTEFISMTSNKLKDWFINFLPDSETKFNLVEEFNNAISSSNIVVDDAYVTSTLDHLKSAANVLDMTSTSIEDIRNINTSIKSLISLKKSEISKAEGAIQSLIHYDDFEECYSEDEYASKLHYVMDGLVAQKSYESQKLAISRSAEQIVTIEATIKDLCDQHDLTESSEDEELDQLNARFRDVVNRCASYEAEITKLTSDITGLSAAIRINRDVINKGDVCPFTNARCASISENLESARAKLAEDEAERDRLDAMRSKDISDKDKLQAESTKLRAAITSKMQAYTSKVQLEDKLAILRSQTSMITEPADNRSIEEWETELKELQDYRTKSEANRRYSELIDKLTSNKFSIDAELDALKCWEKLTGVNGLQSNADEGSPFDYFASKLDKYVTLLFGADCKTSFNVAAKANSFNFGILRNSTYIPYDLLSSGEKCMFATAMMVCIVAESNSPLKLVLIDDLFDHLDTTNTDALFKSLSSIDDIQLIFAGVGEIDFGNSVNLTEYIK